jgi:hypothetical protein
LEDLNIDGKEKLHLTTGHEDSEVEMKYNSTLSLTSALDVVLVDAKHRSFYLRKREKYTPYRWLGGSQGKNVNGNMKLILWN